MSKVVLYSILAVVPDEVTDYWPKAIDCKYAYLTDLVAYHAEEVDLQWLEETLGKAYTEKKLEELSG